MTAEEQKFVDEFAATVETQLALAIARGAPMTESGKDYFRLGFSCGVEWLVRKVAAKDNQRSEL